MKFLLYSMLLALLLFAFWLRLDRLDTYPPGLSGDEAMNTIDAHVLAQTGKLPLYEDTDRPEHLHRIILAVGERLFGPSVWVFRVIAVFVGTLTVALMVWAVRQCVPDLSPLARILAGLTAAAALAVAMGHIVLSRSLYRGLLVPPFMLLYAGFLLRGLRTTRRRDFVFSGVSLGIALHTYTAALFLPVSAVVVGAALVIFRPRQWRDWFPNMVILGAAFAVIASPVLVMLVTDSDRVLYRARDVESGEQLSLDNWRDRAERVWDEYTLRGDINSQYNADRAPLLPETFDLIFRLGLLALLIRVRQPSAPLLASLLVLTALPVLAGTEIPHGLRIVGAFGVFPAVMGMGAAVVLAVITASPPNPLSMTLRYGEGESAPPLHVVERGPGSEANWRAGYTMILGALAVGLAILTIRNGLDAHQRYIDWWDDNSHPWRIHDVALRHGDWFFRTDHRDLGRWLSDQGDQGVPLLVPVEALADATTRTWTLAVYPDVTTLGAEADFVLPPDTRIAVPWALELGDIRRAARQYVLLHDGTITLLPPFEAETHAALLAEIDTAADVLRANGDLLLRVQPVPENTAFAFVPRHESANGDSLAVFDGRAEVVSWRGPRTLSPTLDGGVEEIPVTYYIDWSARKSTNHFYTAFVQLQTQDHTALAGDEGPVWRWLYPPPLWGSGDVIATPYTLVIPGDLAPGAYRVVVGLYIARFTGMNQPVTAAAWGSAGEMATIDWIKVPQADPPALDPDRPVLDIVLGDMFALRQAAGERGTGGLVQVTLTWEGLADRPPVDATVFVHVRDADGTMIAQSDIRPWNGQYPTFIWDAGEIVQTTHTLDLGNIGDHDPADLQVVAGMYTFPGPDRLPVIQGGIAVPDALIDLGTLADLVGGYSP